ncbi:hypothetical protein BDV98DRAFT_171443 [Pterulicium gracile]|uniref:Uncharacterized protein n=1 Tax=Pterulicium gracile TaxID=1884261 RepID=A0A5C3QEB9_9AGAR|nr:hypothetical protein BDV98DRAFT_171443 [Pterula gracilis]
MHFSVAALHDFLHTHDSWSFDTLKDLDIATLVLVTDEDVSSSREFCPLLGTLTLTNAAFSSPDSYFAAVQARLFTSMSDIVANWVGGETVKVEENGCIGSKGLVHSIKVTLCEAPKLAASQFPIGFPPCIAHVCSHIRVLDWTAPAEKAE